MAKKTARKSGAKRKTKRAGMKDLPATGRAAKGMKGGHNYAPLSRLISKSIVTAPPLTLRSS